jgi:hypothetical protein
LPWRRRICIPKVWFCRLSDITYCEKVSENNLGIESQIPCFAPKSPPKTLNPAALKVDANACTAILLSAMSHASHSRVIKSALVLTDTLALNLVRLKAMSVHHQSHTFAYIGSFAALKAEHAYSVVAFSCGGDFKVWRCHPLVLGSLPCQTVCSSSAPMTSDSSDIGGRFNFRE